MESARIRRKFLDFFVAHGHVEVPSSSLEPRDDPTLLFTNAGMVQFKRTFLGQDPRPYTRATTCQKCVRAGGKHNDLEQVGLTRRHDTFFEMLGNFSFGDYFKRDAIAFAWEFVTSNEWLGLAPDRLRVSVHHEDAEARELWHEIAGLPHDRIYGLGDKDNFWQMGDTGPCGPSSEIFVDLDWTPDAKPEPLSREHFEDLAESGRFLEIWNLVFMQFDRAQDGTLAPLPKRSVDTGAGLERLAAVMQDQIDIFHTDLFRPLINRVEHLVGAKYPGGPEGSGMSFRVLADHARAVSFLLLDGVYPSNEGRGFVLRRILRRAVRHAWLLGRRRPTLVELVPTVVSIMGATYPELAEKRSYITDVVRQEEERFLETIEAGLDRLEQIRATGARHIAGEDAFKLFDTYGFPLDLTQLIAAEWGIAVDVAGFERAMDEQRERSRAVRGAAVRLSGVEVNVEAGTPTIATAAAPSAVQRFVGYDTLVADTRVLYAGQGGGATDVMLEDNPFYPGGGGQVNDTGTVEGDGWRLEVSEARRDDQKRVILSGRFEGEWPRDGAHAVATVDKARRHDIERNHSATHLVHKVLRDQLGAHVRQQGSLVEAGRLRFDFSHHAPIEASQLADIEAGVNELILANDVTDIRQMPLTEALQLGAMAFFADKYGDVVRVVRIGDSLELCGGTHVRSSGQVGLFRFTGQTGVAAGVRRIEAATGHGAYGVVRALEHRLGAIAETLRAQPDQLERKVEALLAEREKLEAKLAEVVKAGGLSEERRIAAGPVTLIVTPTVVEDRAQLGELADQFRGRHKEGSVLALINPTAPSAVSFAVTDDLVRAGKDANRLIKLVAARYDGRGGGRPAFASGSLGQANAERVVIEELPGILAQWLTE